jgi:hypothetical protein
VFIPTHHDNGSICLTSNLGLAAKADIERAEIRVTTKRNLFIGFYLVKI